MSNLYLLNFKNYYNRKGKKFDTLTDYLPYEIATLTNTNFNPADGVRAYHTFNIAENIKPDYCVVTNDNSDIVSRWFVMESGRSRGGQYQIELYRDVIADSYDEIINAPVFIEKAILNKNSPLIYNNENMTYNQIKTSETLLKDETQVPWIVGYYDKTKTISGSVAPKYNYDFVTSDAEQFIQDNTFKFLPQNVNNLEFWLNYYFDDGARFRREYILNYRQLPAFRGKENNSLLHPPLGRDIGFPGTTPHEAYPESEMYTKFLEVYSNKYKTNEYKTSWVTSHNGAILYDNEEEKYYRISINIYPTLTTYVEDLQEGTNFFNYMKDRLIYTTLTGTVNNKSFSVQVQYQTISITLTQLYQDEQINFEVDSGCYDLNDAPYRMFAMPYGEVLEKFNDGDTGVYSDKELNFRIANAINDDGSKIYDIQIVPYCPLNDEFIDNGVIVAGGDSLLAHPITKGIEGNLQTLGYIYSCSQSSFSRHITLENPIVITDPKIQNECDMYRLCSPNYAGVFEFNAAKNGGIYGFDITCTYKPYSPYIHLNPDFQNLYGTDFGDNRGLICGGDFSIAKISNAFNEYQLQNKNYQNIFDRQIQNMETNNSYQRELERFSAGVGSITGAVSGATMGGMVGGIPGAIIGGVVGGGASLAGGLKDLQINDALRREAIDFTKDQFGYQLGNIKAQPQTLSKTTAYTLDNKYFPFLEYYTCTDAEKDALKEKIKYNGMTVMAVGKISDFIGNQYAYDYMADFPQYIKCKLIRLEDIEEDFHYANTIAEELYKGVYIE